jgi:hypothetical protein
MKQLPERITCVRKAQIRRSAPQVFEDNLEKLGTPGVLEAQVQHFKSVLRKIKTTDLEQQCD